MLKTIEQFTIEEFKNHPSNHPVVIWPCKCGAKLVYYRRESMTRKESLEVQLVHEDKDNQLNSVFRYKCPVCGQAHRIMFKDLRVIKNIEVSND